MSWCGLDSFALGHLVLVGLSWPCWTVLTNIGLTSMTWLC